MELPRKYCICHRTATKPCVECAGRGYTTPNPSAKSPAQQVIPWAKPPRGK